MAAALLLSAEATVAGSGGRPVDVNSQISEFPYRLSTARLGSPYVPLDSWVYEAFDRLSGMGYAPSAFANLRPWTRMECARIVAEASQDVQINELAVSDAAPGRNREASLESEVFRLHAALAAEFSEELRRLEGARIRQLRVDNIYVRYSGIAGTPLADSYHFGQTLWNDFGRPYGKGSNVMSGASAFGTSGSFAFYLRGEYQHAAPLPAYSQATQQMLGTIDLTPPKLPIHTGLLDQVRMLDAYATWNFKSIQLSAGRESLWWGPGYGGPPSLSDNSPPINMVRLSNPSPWRLPAFFHWLGPMRWDSFVGPLAGHHYPPRAALQGQKLSFKPTPNLEFGFSRTIVFRPLTVGQFSKGFFSVGNNRRTLPGTVGNRHGGFDFSYRIPGLRDWLTLYNDGLTDHNASPLSAPQLSLMNPGFYLTRLPRLPQLDFRAEMAWSDPPPLTNWDGRFFYYDSFFHDSYTNGGPVLGSWVGREGHGFQLWSTYWFSPRNTLQWGYRRAHVDNNFIPQGGNIQDFSLRSRCLLHTDWEINTLVQYERWNFPILSPLAGPDTVASVELSYYPKWGKLLDRP